jgi:light-regulated signal transduction histidine kinase (bacteriophytochrome)
MEALINSILTYSRAGKNTEDQKIVNTLQLVNQVLENSYLTSDCVVLVDNKLPLVKANKKDLYEVFNIFISNAINHNNSKQPVVNITYKELGNMIEFCVADNGQGIAEEFHEKIFTIFQTLERRDEIENIGAGLAIGKKIIEDYGGKTWVQSELDKGAKFFFTWPV